MDRYIESIQIQGYTGYQYQGCGYGEIDTGRIRVKHTEHRWDIPKIYARATGEGCAMSRVKPSAVQLAASY